MTCNLCKLGRFRHIIRGGAKLLQAELGIHAADVATIIERKKICESCEVYDFGICDKQKGGCGCILAFKVKLKNEACTLLKWKSVN